jgi:hypothetical protein
MPSGSPWRAGLGCLLTSLRQISNCIVSPRSLQASQSAHDLQLEKS